MGVVRKNGITVPGTLPVSVRLPASVRRRLEKIPPASRTKDGIPILGKPLPPPEAFRQPAPRTKDGIPILYEDDGYEDMGDTNVHTRTCGILHYGLQFHFADRTSYAVFENLDLYYLPKRPRAYVSPDVMAVDSPTPIPEGITSYRIGKDGPAPFLTMEVLSRRTHQQRDLTDKVALYSRMGVVEYVLVDVTGKFLPQRLLLKRRQPDGSWVDLRDPDGGVTSRFGFRIIIDTDGNLRVLDAKTGKRYARPGEAQAESEARQQAEERIRELETKLERLRGTFPKAKGKKPSGKRRRKS